MELSIEKRVGIFFLLTLITLGVMIELVEDWDPFERRLAYVSYFNAAVGIREGDPVRMAGVEVGKVREISIDKNRVRIDFYVVEGAPVKSDTVAMIRQTNLLGGQFLGLGFGSESAALLPEGSVLQSREGVSLEELIDSFNRNQNRFFDAADEILADSRESFVGLLNRLETVVRKIDDGEGTLGLLVNDPGLYQDLQKAVVQVSDVVARLERGEGTMGKLLNDPALYDDASKAVANLRDITERINAGEGTLGRLVVEDDVYRSLSEALADISEIVDRANRGEGTLGKLIRDETLYQEATDAASSIGNIAGKIDEGKGTLGRLVNEDGIYREAQTALQKIEKTMDGMNDSGPLSALGVVTGTLF